MRTNVTQTWLQDQKPCIGGFAYWVMQKKPDLFDFTRQCITEWRFNWANWLMVRCMDRKQYLRYAMYAVSHVNRAYIAKYPSGTYVMDSVKAISDCVRYDSGENRDIVGDIDDVLRTNNSAIDKAYYAAVATSTANYAVAYAESHAAGDAVYYAAEAADYTYDVIFTKFLRHGMRIMKEKKK